MLSTTDEFIEQHRAKPYVTVDELALFWAVSPQTIRNQISKGALPALRIGRCIRVHVHDVVRYGEPPQSC